ncbi:hypothetical protein VPH35_051583 [Triticum aestivum]
MQCGLAGQSGILERGSPRTQQAGFEVERDQMDPTLTRSVMLVGPLDVSIPSGSASVPVVTLSEIVVDPPAVSGVAHGSPVDVVGSGADASVVESLIPASLIGSGVETNSVPIPEQQDDPPMIGVASLACVDVQLQVAPSQDRALVQVIPDVNQAMQT